MKSVVSILKTSPESVLEDYGRLMRLAGYKQYISREKETCLKINLSWREWFPAASTEPWQLEGVARTLIEDGYDPGTISISSGRDGEPGNLRAEESNGLITAAARHGVMFSESDSDPHAFVPFAPEAKLPALGKLVGDDGIRVPPRLLGNNIIHLPTLKTHSAAGIAGSGMSIFDMLLDGQWEKAGIHEIIADLLELQNELCAGVFTVCDGTLAGDGPGPRVLIPYEKDYIIAGADPVAVDAVIARMMGFDPMAIGYIRLATDRGIGTGEMSSITLEGDDIDGVNFRFAGGKQPHIAGSDFLMEYYWYPFRGWSHVGRIAESGWGQMLQGYLPEGSELERQGRGKGPLLAMAAAASFFGASAIKRVSRLARRSA